MTRDNDELGIKDYNPQTQTENKFVFCNCDMFRRFLTRKVGNKIVPVTQKDFTSWFDSDCTTHPITKIKARSPINVEIAFIGKYGILWYKTPNINPWPIDKVVRCNVNVLPTLIAAAANQGADQSRIILSLDEIAATWTVHDTGTSLVCCNHKHKGEFEIKWEKHYSELCKAKYECDARQLYNAIMAACGCTDGFGSKWYRDDICIVIEPTDYYVLGTNGKYCSVSGVTLNEFESPEVNYFERITINKRVIPLLLRFLDYFKFYNDEMKFMVYDKFISFVGWNTEVRLDIERTDLQTGTTPESRYPKMEEIGPYSKDDELVHHTVNIRCFANAVRQITKLFYSLSCCGKCLVRFDTDSAFVEYRPAYADDIFRMAIPVPYTKKCETVPKTGFYFNPKVLNAALSNWDCNFAETEAVIYQHSYPDTADKVLIQIGKTSLCFIEDTFY